jgi:protocatechuate 3,4-dioxygenase beta subunit
MTRREALEWLSSTGAALAAACGGGTPTSPSAATSTTTPTTPGGSGGPTSGTTTCAVSPDETVGPYPSLGSYVRSDVTEGRPGVPLDLTITVVNAVAGCVPVADAQVEIWQCDHQGVYSEYGNGRGQTFLRGMQVTDGEGRVKFITIYPGWYQGRATHIHVEVTVRGRVAKVTQIAFPEDVTEAVYRTGVYAARGQNPTTNARDNVFADGVALEMITLSGSPATGFTGTFTVGISL